MAEKEKDKKLSDPCHITITKVENGYKICCMHEEEQSLSQRAGWVPSSSTCKDYVEKTRDGVLKRLKEVL